MSKPKKIYEPPAIIFEADVETSAGTSDGFGPNPLDPLKAESLGLDWPVESDFLTPKE